MYFPGLSADEIANTIKLPPKLRDHPYAQEFYGTVEWNSKGIFNHYMGYFDGQDVNLRLLTKVEKCELLLKVGGDDYKAIMEKARESYSKGQLRFALKQCEALIVGVTPFLEEAKVIYILSNSHFK